MVRRMALQEIDRGYFEAQPHRFERVPNARKRAGWLIAAAPFLLIGIGIAVASPWIWAHFEAQIAAGVDNIRIGRGPGAAFVGVMLAGALGLIIGGIFAYTGIFDAKSWRDRTTGAILTNGLVERYPTADRFDELAHQVFSRTLTAPLPKGDATRGKMILQTMEDREHGIVHVWLEAADGRTAQAAWDGDAARRIARPQS